MLNSVVYEFMVVVAFVNRVYWSVCVLSREGNGALFVEKSYQALYECSRLLFFTAIVAGASRARHV